ncbi:LemA family protein [Eubacteriales bacterium OttesenSCG-928-M02]|nr:LemA family protein [Eubacteriales bacterium OttesenSCG-928-M02]
MGWIIFGAVIAVILLWAIGTYNGFVKIRQRVEESFSTMDVYLKKRYDLIPNLVETVKGYTKHEEGALTKVVEARSKALTANDPATKAENEATLSSALRGLLALTESYPDLKADRQFLELQTQLQAIEGDIAQSRKYYNAVVKQLNTKIHTFPSLIIANIFGVKEAPYFTVDAPEERQNVTVSFD